MSYSNCPPPERLSVQQHFETVFQAWVTKLANINCIQTVIIERRRRLFPEGDLDFYTPLDDEAFWIDLPPELLLPGELNLVHEPSIFDSPLIYIPWVDVMAQLVFAHHYGALRSHLREQGVSEQCFEAPANATRMRDTIYQCILAQTQRTDVQVGRSYAFKAPRAYPRSIYTSPRRNAGVLFRTDWSDNILRTVFADRADGKRYFLNQLCRLPVDYTQCRPRPQPIILALALCTDAVDSLTWEGLVTGRTHAWCMGTTFFVSPGMNLSLADVEAIANDSNWHTHCAPEDCCWLRRQAQGKTSMQALTVQAYHSALAKHHGSKLQPARNPTTHAPDVKPETSDALRPETEYHQTRVQYYRQFVLEPAAA